MRTSARLVILFAAALASGACSTESPPSQVAGDGAGEGAPADGANDGTTDPTQKGSNLDQFGHEHTVLDERVLDYNEALRTASLKLVRALPTLAQIKHVAKAKDKKAAYEGELDKMLADPRFHERMIKWWKDVMRLGGAADGDRPSRDTAPTFAARVTVEGRALGELFTAASNTCPTYDGDAHAFMDGECNNAVPMHAGVLTNPGVMNQFYGSMAFRRVRWLQEVFVCTKFPAEYSKHPVQKNGADYVSPWPFDTVATKPIDFQDTKSVICANCHTTINHIAPLLANFDENGMWHDTIQVKTPTSPDAVTTELSHWLKAGETLHWRMSKAVADLPALGKAVAADPDVAECAVTRLYNFSMSKEDVVTDLATVPDVVLRPYLDQFTKGGMNLKAALRSMLTSDDFVRF